MQVESIKQAKVVVDPQPPKAKKSHRSPRGLSVSLRTVFEFVLMVTQLMNLQACVRRVHAALDDDVQYCGTEGYVYIIMCFCHKITVRYSCYTELGLSTTKW